jgi:hypothetical protein
MNTTPEPVLAAPGAGLPAPEHFIARRLFALKCLFGSPAKFTAKFHAERAAIRALVERCPVERRGQRVLIPRLRGMEDSSRHWSVWMTLDHLRITNEIFAGVISQLSQNRTPPGDASTAAVKPSPDADAAVDAAYESSCDRVLAAAAAVMAR